MIGIAMDLSAADAVPVTQQIEHLRITAVDQFQSRKLSIQPTDTTATLPRRMSWKMELGWRNGKEDPLQCL